MSLTNEEKFLVLGYIDEMLDIFDTVLVDDFEQGEVPLIDCNGMIADRSIFESIKEKLS